MALELRDRIYTNCVSTGTDDAWIGETKEGYQGWEVITSNATVYYTITDSTSWEVGYGNYVNAFGAGDKATKAITRNLLSSSTGALLNLSGNASIFLTYPSEKAVILNTDDNIQLPNSNVNFKNVTSNQVTSPAIITEAVIVDGTAGTEGDLAKLLDVYTKEEIQEKINEQDSKNTVKFMGKSGGIFTGEVDFNKTIHINNNFTQVKASLTKPFHTIKTNAPLNPDGSSNTDSPFGLAIDIDNGNTFKNQFDVKNRKGDILSIKGGGSPYGSLGFDWTYNGLINKDHHIANKEYVDNAIETAIDAYHEASELYTLSNNTNTLRYTKGDKALNSLQFGAANATISAGNTYYLNELYDNENNPAEVKNYIPTKDTMFEIWLGNELQVRTPIKFWMESTFSSEDRKFNPAGNAPSISHTGDFNDSSLYTVILTNMKKA